jgi:hypothetical protein
MAKTWAEIHIRVRIKGLDKGTSVDAFFEVIMQAPCNRQNGFNDTAAKRYYTLNEVTSSPNWLA